MRPKLRVIQGGLSNLPRVVTRIHSRDYWEKEYARLTARLERIRMLNAGEATVRVVQVKRSKWVERHRRGRHERIIITKRERGRKTG